MNGLLVPYYSFGGLERLNFKNRAVKFSNSTILVLTSKEFQFTGIMASFPR